MTNECLVCGDEEGETTPLLALACGRHFVCMDPESKCLAETFSKAINNEDEYKGFIFGSYFVLLGTFFPTVALKRTFFKTLEYKLSSDQEAHHSSSEVGRSQRRRRTPLRCVEVMASHRPWLRLLRLHHRRWCHRCRCRGRRNAVGVIVRRGRCR